MPKPVYATVQEVTEAREDYDAKFQEARETYATMQQMQECIIRMEDKHNILDAKVDENKEQAQKAAERLEADLRAFTTLSVEQAHNELTAHINGVDQQRKTDREEMEAALAAMDNDIRTDVQADLMVVKKNLEELLEAQRESLTNLIAERREEAANERARHRREIEELIEKRRQELLAEDAQTRADTAAEFAATRKFQLELDDNQKAKLKQSRAEVDERMDTVTETAADDRTFITDAIAFVRSEGDINLHELKEVQDRHLTHLDQEADNLWDSYREVQELPCRRVEWVIPNASKLLLPPDDYDEDGRAYNSWFSRRFRACGARNLRLEFRVYNLTRSSTDAGSPSSKEPIGGGGNGDCAIFLWCGRGITMHYRLFVGDKSANLDHEFSERCSHGTRRICYAKDQISAADDTLRVGVELLEAIMEIDNQSPVLRQGDTDESPADGESDDRQVIDDGDLGSLLFHRHVNNRLVPQMRTEVERMQSRMVRRIEWNVEQASLLPTLFAAREAICSPVFAAAGVEGMQLLLYPSGYAGATPGFCSMFLYAPAGVSVKCQLSVGNQTRDAINTYKEAGAYGRANFCMFEDCYDKTYDKVTCVFEITHISQALSATTTHTAEERATLEGGMKMLRVPGRQALTETKVLPSLWSAKALSDESIPPADYAGFKSLKAKRAGAGASNPYRPVTGESTMPKSSPPSRRSEATAAFRPESGPLGPLRPESSFRTSSVAFDLSPPATAEEEDMMNSKGFSVDGDPGSTYPLPALKQVSGSGDWGVQPRRSGLASGSKKMRMSSSAGSLAPAPPSSIPPLGTMATHHLPTYVPGLT